jgi:hypothetical protein
MSKGTGPWNREVFKKLRYKADGRKVRTIQNVVFNIGYFFYFFMKIFLAKVMGTEVMRSWLMAVGATQPACLASLACSLTTELSADSLIW